MSKLTKSSLFLFVMVLLSVNASAQITPETTYTFSGTYTFLPSFGNKFYVMDVGNSQCKIFNTDHTLWKTFNLSVPVNNYLYDIRYVSEGLFTNNTSICLAYVYYNYNETGQYYTFNARVVNENGTILLNVPGCQYLYVHTLYDGSTKLVTYSYDNSVWPSTILTGVYSLPGQLFTSMDENQKSDLQPAAFPNPARMEINIPYTLPEGINEGIIELIDASGETIYRFPIKSNTGNMVIPTASLPRGNYLYFIEAESYRSSAGKIILQ